MIQTTDQLGRSIVINSTARKIISLVPSQTELLHALGLKDEVIGITKFCVHPPEWKNEKTIIGGTKNLDINKIRLLQPDFIIGNKEENVAEQVLELSKEFPVWISDIYTLEDALDMILELGRIVGKTLQAKILEETIQLNFATLKQQLNTIEKRETAYLIWRNPYMAVGKNTFIHEMLLRCGLNNVFSNADRYPELSAEQLQDANPDLILLASEPYPFSSIHIPELQKLCPEAQIRIVDGEMFSWYGSHLLEAPDYFTSLLREINSAL